jgi:hypothetical protein
MKACVFTGPTLSAEDARGAFDAIYLPPVKQGDVYRAVVDHRPRAIGIVDGYFQQVPSVWHKEILWAMAQGIHVFGSASMGALRGAELAAFGMRGVGRIFEAFRDGVLQPYVAEAFEDDDEVAVVHGLPETGFMALSESMVNIRCTLARAADAGVIPPSARDAFVRIAKRLFYPDRSYARLLSDATDHALPRRDIDALHRWLPGGQVNQKRDDALAMLAEMRHLLATDPAPARVAYAFERSEMWDRALAGFLSVHAGSAASPNALSRADLLDELRLDGLAYVQARRAGLLRMAALREFERRRLTLDATDRRSAVDALRQRFAMLRRGEIDRWLVANDLDNPEFDHLIEDEARLRRLEALAGVSTEGYLVDQVRIDGTYARYASRARAKQEALAGNTADESDPDEWTRFRLAAWPFRQVLGRDIPEDVATHAASVGFADLDSFYRALWREYLYLTRSGQQPSGDRPHARAPRHTTAEA